MNLWEIAARKLALNKKAALEDLKALIDTLGRNIIDDPSSDVKRYCKFSNKVISRRLVAREGGVETLVAFGFIPYTHGEEKGLIYEDGEGGQEIACTTLETGLKWFDGTVHSILQYAQDDKSVCAEVIVSVRMPVGSPLIGGFMKQETIANVVSYVSNFFLEDSRSKITLRQTHNPRDLAALVGEGGEGIIPTLLSLNLTGRVSLLCTLQSDERRQQALTMPVTVLPGLDAIKDGETEGLSTPETVRSRPVITQHVRQRQAAAAERNSEKESILSQFQADHDRS